MQEAHEAVVILKGGLRDTFDGNFFLGVYVNCLINLAVAPRPDYLYEFIVLKAHPGSMLGLVFHKFFILSSYWSLNQLLSENKLKKNFLGKADLERRSFGMNVIEPQTLNLYMDRFNT